jgi:Flp pilus assembly pilin Flp
METTKIKYALSLAAFIAVLLVGWYFWGPAGGKLTSLNENNFAQFVQEFDGAANDERVLLLLSPT